jgi:ATP/ADP translocase
LTLRLSPPNLAWGNTGGASETAESTEMFMQLVPGIIFGVLYAVVVFVVAQKRKINPWGWTIATLVPFIGLLVAAVFFLEPISKLRIEADPL